LKFLLFSILLFTEIFSNPISRRPDIFAYGGKYSETDLAPIVFRQDTLYRDSHIAVVGVNNPLGTKLRFAYFETETNLVKHFGIMNHFEINTLLIARKPFLFGLPISVAFGEGFSYASENPKLENREKGFRILGQDYNFFAGAYLLKQLNFYPIDTQIQLDTIKSNRLLNFIMVEMDYGFPSFQNFPRVFIRIHHRSGVFGLYCPPDPACGSNFVSYGVKISI
jgi:hypothetical protein